MNFVEKINTIMRLFRKMPFVLSEFRNTNVEYSNERNSNAKISKTGRLLKFCYCYLTAAQKKTTKFILKKYEEILPIISNSE